MERKHPCIIGVAGGTASGKSSVCDKIMECLEHNQKRQVQIITQDSFYYPLSEDDVKLAHNGKFNFDHPDAFNYPLLLKTLRNLKDGSAVTLPKYDFRAHSIISDDVITIHPADVVLVEGILVFYHADIRDLFSMKLFVDTDPDIRLARRVLRDLKERGRDLEHVLHQYTTLVKPAYEEFCLPVSIINDTTKKYADIIIPRGSENDVAINVIVQHIQELIRSPRNTPSSSSSLPNGYKVTAEL